MPNVQKVTVWRKVKKKNTLWLFEAYSENLAIYQDYIADGRMISKQEVCQIFPNARQLKMKR